MAVEAHDATEDDLSNAAEGRPQGQSVDFPSLDQAFRSLLHPVEDLISKIAQRLDELETAGSAAPVPAAVAESLEDLRKRQSAVYKAVVHLAKRLESFREVNLQVRDALARIPTKKAEKSPADSASEILNDRWERVILGHDLSVEPDVADQRQRLLEDVLAGDENAVGLAARIMLVQSASRDELPSLLKELGEAYYRWQPKTSDTEDRFELALVRWLEKRIEAADLHNRIDLVRVGDRYDATRHLSSQRGREVSEVHGWAVLRDNGKPLSKASVSLKQD